MLLHHLKMIGKAFHLAWGHARTGCCQIPASAGVGLLVSQMISHRRDDRDMTPAECQTWIQTGLALAPFCGYIMNIPLSGLWRGPWWENGLHVLFFCVLKELGPGKAIQGSRLSL